MYQNHTWKIYMRDFFVFKFNNLSLSMAFCGKSGHQNKGCEIPENKYLLNIIAFVNFCRYYINGSFKIRLENNNSNRWRNKEKPANKTTITGISFCDFIVYVCVGVCICVYVCVCMYVCVYIIIVHIVGDLNYCRCHYWCTHVLNCTLIL